GRRPVEDLRRRQNWTRLTKGLPSSHFGRVGLDWYQKDPKVVFAIIDCQKIGGGTATIVADLGANFRTASDGKGARIILVTAGGPAAKAGLDSGDVILKFGDKEVASADDLAGFLAEAKPDTKTRLRYVRADKEAEVEVTLGESNPLAGSGFLG